MHGSRLFVAIATLLAVALLIFFGIASMPPVNAPGSANGNGASDRLEPLDKPTVMFGNPVRGPKEAAITIVEFGDFACGPCGQLKTTLDAMLAEFPDKIRLVWKDFPNTGLHKEALNAAVAARCASVQGAFWEYHDLLFASQDSLNAANYRAMAVALGLNAEDFAGCFDLQTSLPLVERDFEEGQRLLIAEVPYLFINDRRVSGAVEADLLREIIRSELAKAAATTAPANGGETPTEP